MEAVLQDPWEAEGAGGGEGGGREGESSASGGDGRGPGSTPPLPPTPPCPAAGFGPIPDARFPSDHLAVGARLAPAGL